MLPARNHSFGPDEQDIHTQYHHGRQQSYHDSQVHTTNSMPPPTEPHSPVSLSYAQPYTLTPSRPSMDVSRDASPQRYTDRSPSPPPVPPPHRTSPSRYSRRDSTGRSIAGAPIQMEEFVGPSSSSRSRERAPAERVYTIGGHDTRLPPSSYQQQGQYANNSTLTSAPHSQRPTPQLREHSYGSNALLAGGAATPGSMTPVHSYDVRSSHYSGRSIPLDEPSPSNPYRMSDYGYSPYHNSSNNIDPTVSDASINPQYIVDDGDDDFRPRAKNRSYPMQQQQTSDKSGAMASIAAAGAARGALGGLFGRHPKEQTASGTYRPVESAIEKSDWLASESKKRKRNSWLCGIGIGLVIFAALAAGVIGGVVGTRHGKSSNTNNANDDTQANGDLDINSAEIKALMNNPNLHKVFPGIDYTPWGVQYPLCLTYPPSQNNVTRDVAVLSQLTNTIRLYGTDCNQTEMTLHALDRLKLTNMKIWLGVWIDPNTTTTERQLSQMYKILASVKDKSVFKGAIIGNEALYRAGDDKTQDKTALIQVLKQVKSNFTSLGYDLPVATSDLGDNWDGDLVSAVDYVMSNIHPFFAGVVAEEAASWTWTFWNQHDVPLTAALSNVKQIISETGWPSDGGTDCGGSTGNCTSGQSGATASVDNMNIFMNDWVCQALSNGTDYFWFEAFDEPWKVQYNTPGKEWEDKWGLMDSARKLKSGVKIPSCGGKTVS